MKMLKLPRLQEVPNSNQGPEASCSPYCFPQSLQVLGLYLKIHPAFSLHIISNLLFTKSSYHTKLRNLSS